MSLETNQDPDPTTTAIHELIAENTPDKKISKSETFYTSPPSTAEADEIVEQVEPWEEEVSLQLLVTEIEELIGKYLVIQKSSQLSLALWVAAAYPFDSFRIFPRVVIHSPEKRCGKTTLLEILTAIVPRGLLASNVSTAAVFRVIEGYRPTLLIDEADAFLKDNEELRGVINSSHTKSGAYVIRCVGDQNEVKKFSTWSPIVLAGIKKVADTIMDRSIVVALRRKGRTESVERLPVDLNEKMLPLRRKLTRWAEDSAWKLKEAQPTLPDSENDRARDNWLPLFAVADEIGEDWRERAVSAFLDIEDESDGETTGNLLLGDIRDIFKRRNIDRIWTATLIADLIELEERPWATWKGGFSSRVLSNMLKDYGVSSGDLRIGDKAKKGYKMEKFDDAFSRYLPTAS